MEKHSRLSSSCKERPSIPPKILSTHTAHTRCESVSKGSKNTVKKYEKMVTQAISSRKYNSICKNSQSNIENKITQLQSPYRTSFSSMKGAKRKRKNTSRIMDHNTKCQSSYNLKDYSFSKQMMNSSEIFNSLYVEPIEMVCLLEKDKPTIRNNHKQKKKNSANTLKNQFTTKRSVAIPCANLPSMKRSLEHSQQLFKRSKSRQTQKNQKVKSSYKTAQERFPNPSFMLSPTQQSSHQIILNSCESPNPYNDLLNRTQDVLNNYERKIKKLYEEKVNYQRMYEKSRQQCDHMKKEMKKIKKNKEKSITRASKDTAKLYDTISRK